MKPQLLIACDFDGTVTRQDTLVEILDRYGDVCWREVQEKVVSGELSIRDGLQSEMGSVRATPEEMKSLLTEKVEVDPTFPGFLRSMRQRGIPLVCLSGGFDLCLEIVLSKAGLWPLPYLANRLIRNNGSWRVEFPYPSLNCQACGHCKGDPIRGWNEQGYLTVFVGNGVTDRCGARHAKLTFAKDELHTWAQAQGIASVRYETFDDVEEGLIRRGWL
ncbi:MAG: HAD-IB family phosphatase [Candidatus Omnitrophica bacterium]|nr:HAD-IB family phosphatase [Candidatus Omnitrophota bacterium]